MGLLVVIVMLHFATISLLFLAGQDWNTNQQIRYHFNIHLPSLHDFEEKNVSLYETEKYVRDVILPAHRFFILLNEVDDENNGWGFVGFILNVAFALAVLFALVQIDADRRAATAIVLAILYPIAIFAIYRFHKANTKIPTFGRTEDDLKKEFEWKTNKNDAISESANFNNYVIFRYAGYLYSVEKIARNRVIARKALSVAAVIVYIFCFAAI